MLYKLRNLMDWFGCKAKPQSLGPSAPLSKLCQISVQEIHNIIRRRSHLIHHAATITIGVKWLGRKTDKEQYEIICERIRKGFPYRGTGRYIFHFELQGNGLLHAHGCLQDIYQGKFIEAVGDLGSRNKHNASFIEVKHIDKYLEYINKENVYPAIHNYKKKDRASANLMVTKDAE